MCKYPSKLDTTINPFPVNKEIVDHLASLCDQPFYKIKSGMTREERRKLIAYIASVGDEYPSYTAKGKTVEQIEEDLNTMLEGDK